MTDPALLSWLREAITERLELARKADTGERWEADKHYDALWTVDLKPGLGQVENWEEARDAQVPVPGLAPYEAPRFLAVFSAHACHIAASDPQDTIARCEAELAILDEHYILFKGSSDEKWEEFSVVSIGGADKDHGCVTCHYYGMGGVKGYGICRTVRLLAAGYKHHPGYAEAGWSA